LFRFRMMPYMLYLARGRDQFKPACSVLLDSDGAGQEARRQILKGGAKGRPTVTKDLNDDLLLLRPEAGVVPWRRPSIPGRTETDTGDLEESDLGWVA